MVKKECIKDKPLNPRGFKILLEIILKGDCKKIKEINKYQSIIITSACEESNYLLELINLGVAQFLLKPIQTEQLLNIIYEVVTNIYNQKK